MLMIEGWIRLGEGDVERLRPAAVAMIEATRKEAGCVDYAFAQDLADPTLFRIVERWESEAALAAHFQTPHMAAFNQAMAGIQRLGGSVKVYEATVTRSLIGD